MTKLTFAFRTFAAALLGAVLCIGTPVFAQQIQVPLTTSVQRDSTFL